MKTIKMKIKKFLKSKVKDFIFNCSRVKADIFWVKEENKDYLQNKDNIQIFFYQKLFNFLI